MMATEESGPGENGHGSSQEAVSRRRRPPVVPVLVLLALIGGLVLLVVARSSPKEQIRRLIDRQIKMAVAGRYGQLHATLTPRAKAACGNARDFAAELQNVAGTDPNFWHLIDIRDIQIRVDGNRAMVTYRITYNGRLVEQATPGDPDVYIRWTQPSVLGPKLTQANVDAQLAALARAQVPGSAGSNPLPPKDYRAARDRIIKAGKTAPVLWKHGAWYDELDHHIHCPI
jgi:hypothetical protein